MKSLLTLLCFSLIANYLLIREELGHTCISKQHERVDRLKDSINNHNTRLFRDHECWYQKVKNKP